MGAEHMMSPVFGGIRESEATRVEKEKSWSRRKHINFSEILTAPRPPPPHFSTAARSLYIRLGEKYAAQCCLSVIQFCRQGSMHT